MRHLNYLSKMTIFGLLLSTIPVIFIGIFSYITSSNEIQNHVNRGKLQLLMQTNANVEQILTTVNHTLNQVVNSTVLKTAMNSPLSVNDFMLYNDLRNELRHMQSFDTKLEDVIVINREQNWMVKNSGVYRLDDYIYGDKLIELIDYPDDTSWLITPSHWFYSEENASNVECNYSISLIKKLPANSLSKEGIALANIPACSLQEFQQFEAEAESELMILSEDYRVLLHDNPEFVGKQVSETGSLTPDQLADHSGQFTASFNDRPYSVIYYKSDFNGWIYISAIEIESMTRESDKIGLYTLAVCLILLLLSIITVWLGSRRMYTPIQRLMKQFGEKIPDIGNRKGNEFQMIGEQVNSLFQSKSQLEQEVRHHAAQVRTFFLIRVCQGNIKNSEIPDKLIQYGYANQVRSWRSMAVITLQIDSLDQTRYDKRDLDLLLFAITNMIEELVPPDERLSPVVIDSTVVTLTGSVNHDTETFSAFLYSLTEHLQRQVESFLDLKVSIGMSQPFTDWSSIPLAYREGLDALRHRIKLGEGIIIQYEDMNSSKHYLNLNYPYHLELELIDAIKLADVELAHASVKQFLNAVLSAELTPKEYQIPLVRLLNNLLIVMQESGISLHQIQHSNHSLFEQLFRLQIAGEIGDWFWNSVVHPLILIFRDRQDAQYHNISEKIIDLIQRHYDTDLTLEQCAAKLHYNANYLSSVFRKETNYSFSEYLTAYRFSMAKKWLAETDMTIKDIAAKLCYNNPQNFIRSFRKHEGMTPGQYREKQTKHMPMQKPHM